MRIRLFAFLASLAFLAVSRACGKDTAAAAEEFAQLAAAPTWVEALRDDAAVDWRKIWTLDGERAVVERIKDGFEFRAGAERGVDADHAVLWTRASFQGDLKISFNYTRTDSAVNDVNILYLHAQGTGDGPYAADLDAWRDLRRVPKMSIYFEHTRAWHLSFAAFQNKGDPGQPDYLRVRNYPVTPDRTFAQTEVPPTYNDTGLFLTGVTYAVTVLKTKDALRLHVSGGGKDRVFCWDLSAFAGPNEGRIGLRHMHTRSARYEGFTVWQRKGEEPAK